MIATVFSMQGLGILTQGVVIIIALASFKTSIQHDPSYLDYVWRITLGVGALPALLGLYLRRSLPETPRYTAVIDNDVQRACNDVEIVNGGKKRPSDYTRKIGENRTTLREFASYLQKSKQLKVAMLAVLIPRFALNVAFYGISFNTNIILQSIGFGKTNSIYLSVFNNAVGQVIIALLGSIPGYM